MRYFSQFIFELLKVGIGAAIDHLVIPKVSPLHGKRLDELHECSNVGRSDLQGLRVLRQMIDLVVDASVIEYQ